MTQVLILLAVSDEIRAVYRDKLLESYPELTVYTEKHHSQAMRHMRETEVLMTFGPLVSPQMFEDAPKLRWIQSLGTGMDGLADQPGLRRDVLLTRVHGIVAPVAEAAIGAMLALSRNMRQSFANQDRKIWQRYPSRLLLGKTIGILGVGAIAEALAPRCKALGMHVVGLSAAPRNVDGFIEVLPISELKTAAPRFDYLVVLTPYSAATRNIVNQAVFAAMKPSAYLINLARGGVVDEDALIAALRQNRLAGAALDVFQTEPLPSEHPLWSMQNVIVTPHLGGLCDVYPELAMPTVLENMGHYLNGDFKNMVNIVEQAISS